MAVLVQKPRWPDTPQGLTVGSDGSVYFTRASDHAILTMAALAASITVFVRTPWSNLNVDGQGAGARLSNAIALATDPAGAVRVADEEIERLYDNAASGASLRKVTTDGTVSTFGYRPRTPSAPKPTRAG